MARYEGDGSTGKNLGTQFRNSVLPFKSANSVQLESAMDVNLSQSSSPNHPVYVSPIRSGRTIREVSKEIDDLRKENFNLKLRIFFMEEKMAEICGRDHVQKMKLDVDLNIQLKNVARELESAREDLNIKDRMLDEALKSTKESQTDLRKATAKITDLEQQLRSLNQELQSREEQFVSPLESESDNAIYKVAFGLNENTSRTISSSPLVPTTEAKELEKQLDLLKNELSIKGKEIESASNRIQELEKLNSELQVKSKKKSYSIQSLTQQLMKQSNVHSKAMWNLMEEGIDAASAKDQAAVISIVNEIKVHFAKLMSMSLEQAFCDVTSQSESFEKTYKIQEKSLKKHSEALHRSLSDSSSDARKHEDVLGRLQLLLDEKSIALETLQKHYDHLRKEHETLCSHLASNDQLKDSISVTCHELTKKVELEVSRENAENRTSEALQRSLSDSSSDARIYKDMLVRLQLFLDEKSSALETLQKHYDNLSKEHETLCSRLASNDQLKDSISITCHDLTKKVELEVSRENAENRKIEALQRSLSDSSSDARIYKDMLVRLQLFLDEKSSALETLQKHYDNLSKEHETLCSRLASNDQLKDSISITCHDLTKKVELEVSRENAENRKIEALHRSLSDSSSDARIHEDVLVRLQPLLDEKSSALETLQKHYDHLRKEHETLCSRLTSNDQLKDSISITCHDLTKKVELEVSRETAENRKIEALHRSLSDSSSDARIHEDVLVRLQPLLDEKSSALETLQKHYDHLRKEHETLCSHLASNDQLKDSISITCNELTKKVELEVSRENAENRKSEALHRSLSDSSSDARIHEDVLVRLQPLLDEKSSALETLQKHYDNLSKEHETLCSRLASNDQLKDSISITCHDLTKKVELEVSRENAENRKIESLQRSLSDSSSDARIYKDMLVRLQLFLDEKSSALETLQKHYDNLSKEHETLCSRLASNDQLKDSISITCHDLTKKVELEVSRENAENRKIEALQRSLSDSSSDARIYKDMLVRLQLFLDEKSSALETLQKHYDNLSKEHETLCSRLASNDQLKDSISITCHDLTKKVELEVSRENAENRKIEALHRSLSDSSSDARIHEDVLVRLQPLLDEKSSALETLQKHYDHLRKEHETLCSHLASNDQLKDSISITCNELTKKVELEVSRENAENRKSEALHRSLSDSSSDARIHEDVLVRLQPLLDEKSSALETLQKHYDHLRKEHETLCSRLASNDQLKDSISITCHDLTKKVELEVSRENAENRKIEALQRSLSDSSSDARIYKDMLVRLQLFLDEKSSALETLQKHYDNLSKEHETLCSRLASNDQLKDSISITCHDLTKKVELEVSRENAENRKIEALHRSLSDSSSDARIHEDVLVRLQPLLDEKSSALETLQKHYDHLRKEHETLCSRLTSNDQLKDSISITCHDLTKKVELEVSRENAENRKIEALHRSLSDSSSDARIHEDVLVRLQPLLDEKSSALETLQKHYDHLRQEHESLCSHLASNDQLKDSISITCNELTKKVELEVSRENAENRKSEALHRSLSDSSSDARIDEDVLVRLQPLLDEKSIALETLQKHYDHLRKEHETLCSHLASNDQLKDSISITCHELTKKVELEVSRENAENRKIGIEHSLSQSSISGASLSGVTEYGKSNDVNFLKEENLVLALKMEEKEREISSLKNENEELQEQLKFARGQKDIFYQQAFILQQHLEKLVVFLEQLVRGESFSSSFESGTDMLSQVTSYLNATLRLSQSMSQNLSVWDLSKNFSFDDSMLPEKEPTLAFDNRSLPSFDLKLPNEDRDTEGSQNRASSQLVDKRLSVVENQQSKVADLQYTLEKVVSQLSGLTEESSFGKMEKSEKVSEEINSLKSMLHEAMNELHGLKETVKDSVSKSQEVGIIQELKENMEKVLRAAQSDEHVRGVSPIQAKDIAKKAMSELNVFKQQLLSVTSSLLSHESLEHFNLKNKCSEELATNITHLELLVEKEKKQNLELMQDLSNLSSENKALQLELDQMRDILNAKQGLHLPEKENTVSDENIRYKQPVSSSVDRNGMECLDSLLEELKQTKERLKAMESKCMAYERDIAKATKEKIEKSNENKILKETVDSQKHQIDESQGRHEEMLSLCNQLKADVTDAEHKILTLEANCVELNETITLLSKANESLTKEHNNVLQKNRSVTDLMQTQMDKIADMNKKHTEYSSEKISLQNKINQLQVEVKGLQRKILDKGFNVQPDNEPVLQESFDLEVCELQSQILNLKTDLALKDELVQQQIDTISDLQKKIQIFEHRCSISESLSKLFEQENSQFIEQISSADKDLNSVRSRSVGNFKVELSELNARVQTLTEALNDKNFIIDEQKHVIANLQTELQALAHRDLASKNLYKPTEQEYVVDEHDSSLFHTRSLEKRLGELNAQTLSLRKELECKNKVIQEQTCMIKGLKDNVSALEHKCIIGDILNKTLEKVRSNVAGEYSASADELFVQSLDELKDKIDEKQVLILEKESQCLTLRKEKQDVMEKGERLETDNRKLKELLQLANFELSEIHEKMQAVLQEKENTNFSLTTKISKLERELEETRKDLSAIPSAETATMKYKKSFENSTSKEIVFNPQKRHSDAPSPDSQIYDLSNEIVNLRNQISNKEATIHEKEEKMAELEDNFQQISRENDMLHEKMSKGFTPQKSSGSIKSRDEVAQKSFMSHLEQQLKDRENKISALQASYTNMENTLLQGQGDLRDIKLENASLKEVMSELRKELENHMNLLSLEKQHNSHLSNQLLSCQQQLKNSEAKLAEAESKIADLKDQLQRVLNETPNLPKGQSEERVKTQRSSKSSLKSVISKRTLSDIDKQVDATGSNQQVNDFEEMAEQKSKQELTHNLEIENLSLKKQNVTLEDQLKETRHQLSALTISFNDLKTSIRQYQEQTHNLEAENLLQRDQIATLEKKTELSPHAKSSKDSLKDEKSNVRQYQEQLHDLEIENVSLREHVADLEKQMKDHLALLSTEKRKYSILSNQIIALRDRQDHDDVGSATKQISDLVNLMAENETQHNAIAELKAELQAAQTQILKDHAIIQEHREDIGRLSSTLAMKEQWAADLEEKVNRIKNELELARKFVEEKTKTINNLSVEIQSKNVIIKALEATKNELEREAQLQITRSQNNTASFVAENNLLHNKIQELEERIKDLQNKDNKKESKVALVECSRCKELEEKLCRVESYQNVTQDDTKEVEIQKLKQQIDFLNIELDHMNHADNKYHSALVDSSTQFIGAASTMEQSIQVGSFHDEIIGKRDFAVMNVPSQSSKLCQTSSDDQLKYKELVSDLKRTVKSKEMQINKLATDNSNFQEKITELESQLQSVQVTSKVSKKISVNFMDISAPQFSIGQQTSDMTANEILYPTRKTTSSVTTVSEYEDLQNHSRIQELISELSRYINMPSETVSACMAQLAKSGIIPETFSSCRLEHTTSSHGRAAEESRRDTIERLKNSRLTLIDELKESKQCQIALENQVQELLLSIKALEAKNSQLYNAAFGVGKHRDSRTVAEVDSNETVIIRQLQERKWNLQQSILRQQRELCRIHPTNLEKQMSFIERIVNIYEKIQYYSLSKPQSDSAIYGFVSAGSYAAKERYFSLQMDIECLYNSKLLLKYFIVPLVKSIKTYDSTIANKISSLSENVSRRLDVENWDSIEFARNVSRKDHDSSTEAYKQSSNEKRNEKEMLDITRELSSVKSENDFLRRELERHKKLPILSQEFRSEFEVLKQSNTELKKILSEKGLSLIGISGKESSRHVKGTFSRCESVASLSSANSTKPSSENEHKKEQDLVNRRHSKGWDNKNRTADELCDDQVQRSHYSSPDLGIESDPNQEHAAMESGNMARLPKSRIIVAQPHDSKNQFDPTLVNVPYALIILEDFELLKKEIEECIVAMKSIGSRANHGLKFISRDGTPKKSFECGTLRGILDCCNTAEICLLRSQKLMNTFRFSLFPTIEEGGLTSEFFIQENQRLKKALAKLTAELEEQDKLLTAAEERLKQNEAMKAQNERALTKRLIKTKKVMRQVKKNLFGETGSA